MRLAFSLSAAAVAVLAFAPAAAANNDFLMGFLLGLEVRAPNTSSLPKHTFRAPLTAAPLPLLRSE